MKNNSFLKLLLDMFYEFADIKTKSAEIGANEQAKKESTLLAKKSIKFSITTIILALLSGLCIFGGIKLLDTVLFVLGVVLLVMGVALIIYVLGYYILSLVSIIKQYSFNNKGATTFALIFNILSVVVTLATIVTVIMISFD